jgi:predicted Fe-Mo cluster-binding NifX family protein
LPYWQDRVSPVLDTADNFLIADIRAADRIERERINLAGKSYAEKARVLRERGVNVLLCGAISDYCRGIFVFGGIEVIAWLRGTIDRLIEAYVSGGLNEATFVMPGCCGRRRRRRRRKGMF